MNLGSWKIDDNLTFTCNTHRFDTGAAADADAAPNYRVYEDETGTPLLTGSMALLDDANTVGFYSEQIALSAANGFEKGKCYSIRIAATVNGVSGAVIRTFQIEAEVDANAVSDSAVATASALATVAGYLDTEVAAILAAVDTEVGAIKAKTDNLPASPAAVGSAMTLAAGAVDAAAIAADAWARLGVVAYGTAQSAAAANVVVAAGEGAKIKAGCVIGVFGSTQGYSQWSVVHSVNTDTVAVDPWAVVPGGTITYVVYAAAPASSLNPPPVNVTQWKGSAAPDMTGDAYARLGAPAGASVIADLGTATAATQAIVLDVKAKTDNLPASPAAVGSAMTLATGAVSADALAADAGTEIAAAVAAHASVAAIKAKTDNLPAAPAAVGSAMTLATDAVSADAMSAAAVAEIQSGLATAANVAAVAAYVDTEVASILTAVDTEVGAIKAKTDLIPASPAATGDIPSAATIAAAVWGYVVEGSLTALNIMRGILAWFGAPKTIGAGTTNPRFRDQADTKNRIDMTVNTTTGERSAVTLDLD